MEHTQKIQERLNRILKYSLALQEGRTFERQNRNTYLRIIDYNAKQIKTLVEEDAGTIKAKILNVHKEQTLLKKAILEAGSTAESAEVICKVDRNKLLAYMGDICNAAGYMKRILMKQLKEELGDDQLPTEDEELCLMAESMKPAEIEILRQPSTD